MKIAFITLGCKLNYAESSTYERGFKEAGLEVCSWRDKADVYLINTCTVTATSDAKSRNMIRKVHRVNPEARIVVTGCYAQMHKDLIQKIDGVSLVIGATEKADLVRQTLLLLGIDCPETKTTEAGSVFVAYSSGERTRSYLKVQDGCDNFCNYCTVPYARGRSRNIPICEAVRCAGKLASEGVREIVLTGVNTGDFGRTTGESFLDLLRELDKVEGIERYRISSIEPNLLTNEIIDWIASGTKFQPHFHIPLQSGSDIILKRMGRHYDTAFFEDKINYIRTKMEGPGKPKVFFGIDLMTGLPGEDDEIFNRSLEFLERIRPAFIHVFPYSVRPGTPAASMDGQVSREEKDRRVKKVEKLCEKLHEEFIRQNRGIRERVIFESKCKDGTMSGYTGNYIRITREWDPSLVGEICEITI